MTDTTLSEALKEAYASAPSNTIVHPTLELYHSAFVDSNGQPAPIRVVRDYNNLTATLESTAPRQPGQTVTFIGFNFDFTKPEVGSDNVPQISITMDNVDRVLLANIEKTMGTFEQIKVIYREYISTNLTAPQNNPPLEMTIISITADLFKITATAGFPNLMNKKFPIKEYTMEEFTGLSE